MNEMINFHSVLAEQMQQFVAFKRMQGYAYSSQARTLSYFDRFLFEAFDGVQAQCLSIESLHGYVATTAHLEGYSRCCRLSSLREFTLYLHARCPNSALLPRDIVPHRKPVVRFYRINPEQVADIMAASVSVLPADSIRTHAIRVLIGLLYCTGLRISEALSLTLGDIDMQRSVLHVAKGKFSKQRLVPVSPSTLTALSRYLTVRSSHAGTGSCSALFIGSYDKALSRQQAYRGFLRLCQHCGLGDKPSARLHDLRHNYACRRLALWREEGRDIHAMLPVLATAMGHVNIVHTQIYLHMELGDLCHAAALLNTRLNTHSEPKQ
jgi:site-specific recombinase XerD